jgi:hypothetical protein
VRTGRVRWRLGIDGVLEGLRAEVQWGAGWSRGGVLAQEVPFLFGALALWNRLYVVYDPYGFP